MQATYPPPTTLNLPKHGLLGQLPVHLSDPEAIGASYMVLGGGGSNEVSIIGFAPLALGSNPHLRQVLFHRSDPPTSPADRHHDPASHSCASAAPLQANPRAA